jgi:hypothetical protein
VRIDVTLLVQEFLDQFPVTDDDGGVVISLQSEKSAILLGPFGKPVQFT